MTTAKNSEQKGRIAYQGEPGAYSELACVRYAPTLKPMACATFERAFEAVQSGEAVRAMIPIENTLAGRVADVHHLLPEAGLYIVGEHFLAIEHSLLARKGTKIEDVTTIRSHAMALGQCRSVINELGATPVVSGDTAGAAKNLSVNESATGDAVIASARAAEIYGLDVLRPNIEDADHNTTRFLEMAAQPEDALASDGDVVTSFVFQVRNIPAALYKALGGFATNRVNMTKLESYMRDGEFTATLFYADIEGHPDEENVRLALEELSFFSNRVDVLGIYRSGRARTKSA